MSVKSRLPLDVRGLLGEGEVMRLSGAVRSDPAVAGWFVESELRTLARTWFERMRHCGEDVLELIHDGCPVACIEDVPFGYVNAFRSHVNVGFFRGAALPDPAGLLEGTGKRMRHVKLRPDRAIDAAALGELIDSAYTDIKARLGKA